MTTTVFAYVLVTLTAGSEKDVLKNISNLKEVVEVDLMYGGYDAIVKVSVEDLAQLDTFLTEKLRVFPAVFQTATLIVAKQYKDGK